MFSYCVYRSCTTVVISIKSLFFVSLFHHKLFKNAVDNDNNDNNNNNNSVALVCKQTIQTERLSLVGEASANFCR
jgi:hypothetical protein